MRNVPKLGTPPGAGVDLWGNIVSFSAPGDLFSAFEFARSATHQESPSITPVGSDFFITWQEFVPSEKKSIVFGSRLLATGELPDGRGIRIADRETGLPGHDQGHPAHSLHDGGSGYVQGQCEAHG